MKRETPDQLLYRMHAADRLVPRHSIIRHVKTGAEYFVRGHSLRVGDLALMVNYSTRPGYDIVFSREVESIRAKFVLADGEEWPDA